MIELIFQKEFQKDINETNSSKEYISHYWHFLDEVLSMNKIPLNHMFAMVVII